MADVLLSIRYAISKQGLSMFDGVKNVFERPKMLKTHSASKVDQKSSKTAPERLLAGEQLIVTDHYSTGAQIIEQLRVHLPEPKIDASYDERQGWQRLFRKTAERLIVPIVEHRVALGGARPIGFLKELYVSMPNFYLPFLRVQDLHSSWTRYEQGVYFAVLGHRLHPFYGTYCPKRTVHLELFGTWLSQYKGQRKVAVDVGTGTGILAFMLSRAGFEEVTATDSNPNAIHSLARDLDRFKTHRSISPIWTNLLEQAPDADLIVFNPPWIQAKAKDFLGRALYFHDDLFEVFFDQAFEKIKPKGRIVLVFSNVIELVQPDCPHPIEAELSKKRFRLVQKMRRKVKSSRDASGSRRRTKERVEIWELERSSV